MGARNSKGGLTPYAGAEATRRSDRRFDHSAAIAEVKAGATMQSVGDKFGVSRERIRQIVRRAGIAPATGMDTRASLRADVPGLVRSGLTDAEIGKRLGLTVLAVASDRRKAGLSECGRHERLASALEEHVAAGGSLLGFSRANNLDRGTVFYFSQKLGLAPRHGRHRDLSHRVSIIRQCRADGLSWSEVSKKLAEHERRPLGDQAAYTWSAKHAADLIGLSRGSRRSSDSASAGAP